MAQVLNNPVVIVGGGGGDNLWNDYVTNKGTDWSYMFVNFAGDSVSPYLTGQDSSNVTNTPYMFSQCKAITSIPDFNTSNVTNMDSMFFYCENLRTAPTIDTSKTTNMNNMFRYCRSLESIPAYDTSKVTKIGYMFYSCQNLISVPFMDLSSATEVSSIFDGCKKLKTIEVTSWEKVTSTYSAGSMCANCYSLKDFIIRNATKAPIISAGGFDGYGSMFKSCYHFMGTFHYEYNPRGLADARIYIKDELVDTLKAAAN
jgi:surface protein